MEQTCNLIEHFKGGKKRGKIFLKKERKKEEKKAKKKSKGRYSTNKKFVGLRQSE
jgi:hypothetical protein